MVCIFLDQWSVPLHRYVCLWKLGLIFFSDEGKKFQAADKFLAEVACGVKIAQGLTSTRNSAYILYIYNVGEGC